MILKSIILAVVLLCGYSYFLSIFETPSASQNQNQDNLVKAQQYMYNEKVPENVIVGTSLSCHIHTDSLDDFYNLSFNGSSIYDGLNVILNGVKFPKNVFIESNLYLNDKSELLYNQLYDVYPYYSAKYMNVVRVENQPIGKLIYTFNPFGDRIVEKHNLYMKRLKQKLNQSIDKNINTNKKNNIFKKMIAIESKKYSEFPSKFLVSKKIKVLDSIIDILYKKGVNVIFYEMPINHDLMKSKRTIKLRNDLKSMFRFKVKYFSLDMRKYITSDGVHLNPEESIRYTDFFKKQILKQKI